MSKVGLSYTPINKGHFELETSERKDRFERILSRGWVDEYVKYRFLWEDLPKRKIVRDYPLLVDLELASKCNLSCPMCPTVTEEFQGMRLVHSPSGLMDTELAKKIIDEVCSHVYSLRLSWVGESTLHPQLIDIVQYAKDKGIKEVSFLTNGTKLHLSYMKKLIESGLDIMTVSIDGMNDAYNKIRAPLQFDKTLNNLVRLKEYKEGVGLAKPLIKIQGVWPAIRPNPSEYYNAFESLVDFIAFNPLIDYLHNDQDIVYEENFSCPQPYQRVTVSSDGRVAMCSNDDLVSVVLGNAWRQSIHEIWHSDEMNEIRKVHNKTNGFLDVGACRNCYYPRKIEANEIAIVNGRKIAIENYINRVQEIGS